RSHRRDRHPRSAHAGGVHGRHRPPRRGVAGWGRMNSRDLLVEVWRNLRTGTARAALFALSLATAVGALTVADARSVVGLHRDAAEYIASGASVRVLSTERAVDGVPCESLTGVPGITAAGAMIE